MDITRRWRIFRAGGWGVLDQAFSSLTNAAVSIAVARTASASGFGAFSLAFAAYLLCYGLSQNVGGSPLMIRFAARSEAEQRTQIPACLGIDVVSSLIVGIPLAVAGMALGHELRVEFVIMAICLPGTMMQSTLRWTAFVRRRPSVAALSDGICAMGQAIAFAALWIAHVRSPGAYVAAWGAAGALSTAIFCVWQKLGPSIRAVPDYLRTHRDLLPNLLGEYTAFTGASQALPYILLPFLGLSGVGAIRAAQVVLGLINVPLQGLSPLIAAQAARTHAFARDRLPRLMHVTVIGGSALIIMYGAFLVIIPDEVGKAIAGSSWVHARSLLIPICIVFLGQWVTNVAFTAMRIRSEVAVTFKIRVTVSALLIAESILGAWLAHAAGAAWGMGTASMIAAGMSWVVFRQRLRTTST